MNKKMNSPVNCRKKKKVPSMAGLLILIPLLHLPYSAVALTSADSCAAFEETDEAAYMACLGATMPSDTTECNSSYRPIVFVPATGSVELLADNNITGVDSINPGEKSVWWDDSIDWYLDDDEVVNNLSMTYVNTGTDGIYKGMKPSNANVLKVYTTGTREKGYWDGLIDKMGKDCVFEGEATETCSYENLRQTIQKSSCYSPGKTLFSVNYLWLDDWQKACEVVDKVVGEALTASGADKVHLMGHSQGTQIIDACLTYYKKSTLPAKVASVTHFAPLYAGASPEPTWQNMMPGLGGAKFVDLIFGGIFVSAENTSKIARYSPGMYLMSPTSKYESSLKSSYGLDSSFTKTIWNSSSSTFVTTPSSSSSAHAYALSQTYDGVSKKQLGKLTDTVHVAMDNSVNFYNIPLLIVRGTKHDTPVQVAWYQEQSTGLYSYFVTMKAGDHTVPALSSSSSLARTKQKPTTVELTEPFVYPWENPADYPTKDIKADHSAMLTDGTSVAILFDKYVSPFLQKQGVLIPEKQGKKPALGNIIGGMGGIKPDGNDTGSGTVNPADSLPIAWNPESGLAEQEKKRYHQVYNFTMPLLIDGLLWKVSMTDKSTGNTVAYQVDAHGDVLRTGDFRQEGTCVLNQYLISNEALRLMETGNPDPQALESAPFDQVSMQMRIRDLSRQDNCSVEVNWVVAPGGDRLKILAQLKNRKVSLSRYQDKPDYPREFYGTLNSGVGAIKLLLSKTGKPSFSQAGKPVKFATPAKT